jgi:glycosyltransferase involved in cell wall biosynthesis
MLESVLPHVDSSYVLVDDRTTDETISVCERMGCRVALHTFENCGKSENRLLKRVAPGADWMFLLFADETASPRLGARLRWLAESLQRTETDVVYVSRRHWTDLDMRDEWRDNGGKVRFYPDLQPRLLRCDYPRVHCTHYVHDRLAGVRRTTVVREDIHHFNFHWQRVLGTTGAHREAFRRLKALETAEGGSNIWPDD